MYGQVAYFIDLFEVIINEDLLCLYMLTGGVAKYVELLMDGKCFTKAKMLNNVCRQDSYFLSEGRDLMNQEFSDDSVTYFSILQLIANGMTRRADIDGALMKDTGTFIQNLERDFGIRNIRPVPKVLVQVCLPLSVVDREAAVLLAPQQH